MFRDYQSYPETIQAYSEPCVILTYLGPMNVQDSCIFRAKVILRNLLYSEPEAYSKLWHIQNQRHIKNPIRHLRQSI